MKKGKKFLCMLFSVVMLISCMATSVWAAETTTQDGLNAVIQTDKDTYAANEDIQINVTVTNTNAFEVKNVSIENFLPDDLTLKSGSLKSDTVNLKPNETLTLSCIAVLEKSEEPTSSTPNPGDPGTTSSSSPSDEEATSSAITPNESGTISNESNTSEDSSTTSSKPMVNPNNPPQTGDNFPIFLSFLLLIISAIAVVAIAIAFKKEKKTRKIISLILCCAIGASSITAIGFIRASAEENNRVSFTVDKAILVDGDDFTFNSTIEYNRVTIEKGEQIFRLKVAPFDILVGERTTVKFYATYILDDRKNLKPAVYDENDNFITYLYDDGQNGDETANDNVYSVDFTLYSDKKQLVNYYVKVDDKVVSNGFEINFYKHFTEQELEDAEKFDNELEKVNKNIVNSEGYIKEKDVKTYLLNIVELCENSKDIVLKYSVDWKHQSVYIELYSGISYLMVPPIKGQLSGGNDKEILTVVPDGTEFQVWLTELILSGILQGSYRTPSEIAHSILQADNTFSYPDANQLENGEVTIDALKNLSPFKVLIWYGHGAYAEEEDLVCLRTSTDVSKDYDDKYAADIQAKRVRKMWTIPMFKHYAITSKFIDAYFPDLDDAIIYFGSCYSCANNSISDSLISKGASAVYGYTTAIECGSELEIRELLFKSLCKNDMIAGNKVYYTVQQAYTDMPSNADDLGFTLRTGDPNARLIETVDYFPCNVSGTIVDAETNKPLQALVTISRLGQKQEVMTSSEDGIFRFFDLKSGEYKINVISTGYQSYSDTFFLSEDDTDYSLHAIKLQKEGASSGMPTDAAEFNGHYYYVYNIDSIKNWNDAQKYCEAQGGYLATITSAEEDTFLYSYMLDSGYNSALFGLTDQDKTDVWTWVTGEPYVYENWHRGEPNHQGGYEHYGMYYYKNTDGTWNDGSGIGGPFICEWGEYPEN